MINCNCVHIFIRHKQWQQHAAAAVFIVGQNVTLSTMFLYYCLCAGARNFEIYYTLTAKFGGLQPKSGNSIFMIYL